MKKIALGVAAALLSANASAGIIDTFSESHGATDSTLGVGPCVGSTAVGTGCFSSITPSTALGGERELFVDLVTDPFGTAAEIVVNGAGVLNFNVGSGATASASLTYDGIDGSAAINPFGLGGADLTDNGTENAFIVDVLFADSNFDYEVNLWDFTSGLQVANASFTSIGGSNFQNTISFGDAQFAAVDFSNVGALQFVFDPNAGFTSLDMTVDNLATVPEPTPLALLAAGLIGIGWYGRKDKKES